MTTITIAGGGLAGHRIAHDLQGKADVTLIDPKSFFEVPMAMPRHLVAPGELASMVDYDCFLGSARRVQSRVAKVRDGAVLTEDGEEIAHDWLVLATGADYRSSLVKPHGGDAANRLAEYQEMAEAVRRARTILIVGGGPIGVEIAGEIIEDHPGKKVVIVEMTPSLLGRLDPKLSRWARDHLERGGVEVLVSTRLAEPPVPASERDLTGGIARTEEGRAIPYDLALWCLGARPDAGYMRAHFAHALNERGEIRVAPSFEVPGVPNTLALGDVTDIALKGGLWVEAQVPVLVENLSRRIREGDDARLKAWTPSMGPTSGIVTLGRRHGLVDLPFGRWRIGWLARALKSADMLTGRYRKGIGLGPAIADAA